MPRCRDLAIFVVTTDRDNFTLAHARGVNISIATQAAVVMCRLTVGLVLKTELNKDKANRTKKRNPGQKQ